LNSFCHFSKSAFRVDDDDDDSYYGKYGKVMMIVKIVVAMNTLIELLLVFMIGDEYDHDDKYDDRVATSVDDYEIEI